MTLHLLVGLCLVMTWLPASAHADKWTDFAMVSTKEDVVVSYRQRLQKDGWFVEWKVENKSADWVEPFPKSRTYLCPDGSQKKEKEKTLGPYPPGDERKGSIRDKGIC